MFCVDWKNWELCVNIVFWHKITTSSDLNLDLENEMKDELLWWNWGIYIKWSECFVNMDCSRHSLDLKLPWRSNIMHTYQVTEVPDIFSYSWSSKKGKKSFMGLFQQVLPSKSHMGIPTIVNCIHLELWEPTMTYAMEKHFLGQCN